LVVYAMVLSTCVRSLRLFSEVVLLAYPASLVYVARRWEGFERAHDCFCIRCLTKKVTKEKSGEGGSGKEDLLFRKIGSGRVYLLARRGDDWGCPQFE
jgi:hypothetical protein